MADETTGTGQVGGTEPQISNDSKNMGMLCHLLGLFTSFLGPLIIWLIKKDQDTFVDDQGKEALNWQITFIIAYFAGAVSMLCFVGFIVVPALILCDLIFCIMGAVASSKGTKYRYPFAIRLLK
jgi:uncharacterized protein